MAAEYYKEKEHAFVTIGRDIKAGNIPGLVLLCGVEDYLIRWYSDVLIKKYVSPACMPIDLVRLEGETVSVDKIMESLETVSLMSERKIVFLPDFAPAEGEDLKGFSSSDVSSLIKCFENIPDGSMLLIAATRQKEGKNRKSKLRTAVEKWGRVYDFQPLGDSQLRSFIAKRFNWAGKAYSNSVVNMIITESGYGNKSIEYSLYNLENDLKKIIAHSGAAEEITAADVGEVLATNPENNVFAMLDAIGRNRKDEAFRLLHNLLGAGSTVYSLLGLIISQLELILTVKEMREEGLTQAKMQKQLGIHQFRIKKASSLTSRYSMEDLKHILSQAYEVDHSIKTGLFEGQLALEMFVARL